MMSLFRRKAPLDQDSIDWLLETFQWALNHHQAQHFYQHTTLVRPDNRDFPGREHSVDGMARLILRQVQAHAGMGHWPLVAVPQVSDIPAGQLPAHIAELRRGQDLPAPTHSAPPVVLPIPYAPELVGNPEALIAHYAQGLAQYLAASRAELPPGGDSNWGPATEVLGVYLGFGLMFANTAFEHRGGCGSQSARMAHRQSSLSQYDITYALALFCQYKKLPAKAALPHLKSSLRGHFKQCLKHCQQLPQVAPLSAQP